MEKKKARAKYVYIEPTKGMDFLQIIDTGNGKVITVTNDMENVLNDIAAETGLILSKTKIIYRDTEKIWDAITVETTVEQGVQAIVSVHFVQLGAKDQFEAMHRYNARLNTK